MYNQLLDTFKLVAEEGSFTKAAHKLYLTHTAVRKQINQLENLLETKLFIRDTTGVSLTTAGQILYTETLKLMNYSAEIVSKVQAASDIGTKEIRVGSSNLYPCQIFMDLWDQIRNQMPSWLLKVVTVNKDRYRLSQLGRDYDFIVGPYDSFPLESKYAFQQIGTYRFTLAVPRTNHLANNESLSLSDLAGIALMVMKKGTSPINDQIRQTIIDKYPKIDIIDVPSHYDIQTFNQCASTGSILLSLECWDRVHPEIKNIKLTDHFELPYGLTYLKADQLANDYVTQLKSVLSNDH